MLEGISLLHEMRSGRFNFSLITTYSIDFAFYETVVLRRLAGAGCEQHILLVDARRCAEALADPERRPRLAGIAYTLVPVYYKNSFHPKIVLLAGRKSAKLFVGSHNVTFSGFGGNAEQTTFFSLGANADHDAFLFADAFGAIRTWIEEASSSVGRALSELVEASAPWSKGRLKQTPKTPTTRLLWSAKDKMPLWDQLRPHLPRDPQRVVVAGPFFDTRMEFLHRLVLDLRPSQLTIAIDPSTVKLDVAHAKAVPAELVDIRPLLAALEFRESSNLHAKFMLVESAESSVLITGSANPSFAAWLGEGINAEAITVRTDVTDEELAKLGLHRIVEAPPITETHWAEMAERMGIEKPTDVQQPAMSTRAAMAVEEDGRITVYQPALEPETVFVHHNDPSEPLPVNWQMENGVLLISGTETLDLRQCALVEIRGTQTVFAVVDHKTTLIPAQGTTSVRGELSAAMSGIGDDPTRLIEVMKIIEKAISDENIDEMAGRAIMRAQSLKPEKESGTEPLGPRSIPLEEARRKSKARRVLAEGNVAEIMDLLIRKLSKGLPIAEPIEPPEPDSNEEGASEWNNEVARGAPPPTDHSALISACHGKVRKLLTRMKRRLADAWNTSNGAIAAIVQLAAVLGVLRWLEWIRPQLPWVPIATSLLPHDRSFDDFCWNLARWLGVSRRSISAQVHHELGPEHVDELSLSLGLSAWLAYEAGIDIRKVSEHPNEKERGELQRAGHFAGLMQILVQDEPAIEVLREALSEQRGNRSAREEWLTRHQEIGWALALAAVDPTSVPIAKRATRRGDIARVKMPNGNMEVGFVVDLDDAKVRIADPERDEGRPVLKCFVEPIDVERLLASHIQLSRDAHTNNSAHRASKHACA